MTGDVRDLLPLYALGILEPEEASGVERALAADPGLAADLAAYQLTTDAIGAAILPVTPPPEIKQRLLASAGGGPIDEFSGMISTVEDETDELPGELVEEIVAAAGSRRSRAGSPRCSTSRSTARASCSGRSSGRRRGYRRSRASASCTSRADPRLPVRTVASSGSRGGRSFRRTPTSGRRRS